MVEYLTVLYAEDGIAFVAQICITIFVVFFLLRFVVNASINFDNDVVFFA